MREYLAERERDRGGAIFVECAQTLRLERQEAQGAEPPGKSRPMSNVTTDCSACACVKVETGGVHGFECLRKAIASDN